MWEKTLKERMCILYNWITLLYGRNYHNFVNQLNFNKPKKKKKERKEKNGTHLTKESDIWTSVWSLCIRNHLTSLWFRILPSAHPSSGTLGKWLNFSEVQRANQKMREKRITILHYRVGMRCKQGASRSSDILQTVNKHWAFCWYRLIGSVCVRESEWVC